MCKLRLVASHALRSSECFAGIFCLLACAQFEGSGGKLHRMHRQYRQECMTPTTSVAAIAWTELGAGSTGWMSRSSVFHRMCSANRPPAKETRSCRLPSAYQTYMSS